jgi:peptidoglycan hydrolase-like protein with peptidoglycan-binding domain
MNTEVGTSLPGTTYFGSLTRSAVKSYQTMKGISPVSGYVGPLTRAALNNSTAPSTPTTGNLPAGCTSTVGLQSSTTGVKCDSHLVQVLLNQVL